MRLFNTLTGLWERWNLTSGSAHVVVKNSLIEYFWAGSGLGSAPSATNLRDGVLGADSSGISTGLTYHVVSGAWIATGATVANLYGG